MVPGANEILRFLLRFNQFSHLLRLLVGDSVSKTEKYRAAAAAPSVDSREQRSKRAERAAKGRKLRRLFASAGCGATRQSRTARIR